MITSENKSWLCRIGIHKYHFIYEPFLTGYTKYFGWCKRCGKLKEGTTI